jgi:hypothetical protein
MTTEWTGPIGKLWSCQAIEDDGGGAVPFGWQVGPNKELIEDQKQQTLAPSDHRPVVGVF